MEGRKSFDNESIRYLYSRTHSICSEDFYGSAKSELPPKSGQSESVSKWDAELIPRRKKNIKTFIIYAQNAFNFL